MYTMSQNYSLSAQAPSRLEYLTRTAEAYLPLEQKNYAITASSQQQYRIVPLDYSLISIL